MIQRTITAYLGGQRCQPAKLDAISHEKDYIQLVMQIALALEGFGTIRGFHGQALQDIMQVWGGLIQDT